MPGSRLFHFTNDLPDVDGFTQILAEIFAKFLHGGNLPQIAETAKRLNALGRAIAIFAPLDEGRPMSSREMVIEFVTKLPEDMPLVEIARAIELLAGIQKAREQAHRNEGLPTEEARKLVDEWASK